MIKKLNKKIVLITLLLITIFSNITPIISNAAKVSGYVDVFNVGVEDELLEYKHGYFSTILNFYYNDNKPFPAYNALYPTYNYNDPTNTDLISKEEFVWQVIAHGYPYKDYGELDCEKFEEAYVATQVAVYCAYCGHLESDYTYFEGNESSKRTYDAFRKILKDARENPIDTTKPNNILTLANKQSEWKCDDENSKYLYREYSVNANYNFNKYFVEITNFEGAIITDENNIEKQSFNSTEIFKVMLPISSLNENGEIEIQITTDVYGKPMYLSTATKNKYILTAPEVEEHKTVFSRLYEENLTSVNIEVRELDTKIGIENALVNLLDENKQKISTLTTNERGKIIIEHLIPGTYYIEQIASKDGYNIYKNLIELNMSYNKVLNLTINNAEENITNIYNNEENINITEEIIETNINNKYTETNINNKTEITNENNTNIIYTENNNTIENNVNNEKKETTINNSTNTTNENNKNNIHTENNNTVENNINNEKTETTVNNNTNITNETNTNNINTENNNTNENKQTVAVRTLPQTGM